MYTAYHEAFNVYQCPANNYITHYHVLAPIHVNLKLLYRDSCVLVQSTLHKCTTVWLTGKTQAALHVKQPPKLPLKDPIQGL